MADSDIVLSVDLDPKDALQTAKELGREVEKSLNAQRGKEASSQMASYNSQLKQATTEAQRLSRQLDEVSRKKVPTQEYREIQKQIDNDTKSLEKLALKMEEFRNFDGDTTSDKFHKMTYKAEELRESIAYAKGELKELQENGKGFVDPKATEEYKKISAELDKINDKTKVLLTRKRELDRKETAAAVGGEGGGMAGFAGYFTGAAKSATLALGVVKKLGKALKRGLLTLAAFTLGVRGIMGIIRRIRRMVIDGFKTLTENDSKLKKETDEIKKSWEEVKVNLVAAFLPIIELAIPYVQQLLNWINLLIGKLAMFAAAISGQNAYTKAIKKTGDAAGQASKQLSKLDELNNRSTGGGGADTGFTTEKVPVDASTLEMVEKLKGYLEEAKNVFNELVATPFKEGFFSALGDWESKLEKIRKSSKNIGKALMSIFSDKDLQKSFIRYEKSVSKLFGEITGLAANFGLNVATAMTEGFSKFLDENKDDIKEKLTEIYSIGADDVDRMSEFVDSLSRIVDVLSESEAVSGTLSNVLTILWNVLSGVEIIVLKLVGALEDLLFPMIINNVEPIKTAIDRIWQILQGITEFVKTVVADLLQHISDIVDRVVKPVFETVGNILSGLLNFILSCWDKISPIFTWLFDELTALYQEYVSPIVGDIIDIVSELFAIILPKIEQLWKDYCVPYLEWFAANVAPIIVPILKVVFETAFAFIKSLLISLDQVLKAIKDFVKMIGAILEGDFTSALKYGAEALKDLFVKPFTRTWGELLPEVLDKFKDYFKEIFTGLVTAAATSTNLMITIFETLYNTILKFLNNIKLDIPDWVPELGGKSFGGFNIPEAHWGRVTVPALATGTVIPPSMGEFIARLGDNNRETEVVSPISTMKQAFIEAMQESGGFGGEMHIHVDIDGKEITEVVVKADKAARLSKGSGLFAY